MAACARAGISRLLCSGGAADALRGVPTLRKMVEAARAAGLIVAAGGGVTEANAREIAEATSCHELHGSFRAVLGSAMRYRPPEPLPMGAEKTNGPETEFERRETDATRVEAVRAVLA